VITEPGGVITRWALYEHPVATGDPAPVVTATGLPLGLSIGPDGSLVGAPRKRGVFKVVFTATNVAGTDEKTVFFRVVPPVITAVDRNAPEGDNAIVRIEVNVPLQVNVNLSVHTADGTATDADYKPASGSAVILKDATYTLVSLSTIDDSDPESDETFQLVVTTTRRVDIADPGYATITILDNDS
jgi:hypothetical protein